MATPKEPSPEDRAGFWSVLQEKAKEIGFGQIVYTIAHGQIVEEEVCKKRRFTVQRTPGSPNKKAA